MDRRHRSRGSRGPRRLLALLAFAATIAACVPDGGGGTPPPTRPQQWAAELQKLLDDPAFVESLGSTDEERRQALEGIRAAIANPGEGYEAAAFDAKNAEFKALRDAADKAIADARRDQVIREGEIRQREVGSELLGAPTWDDVKNHGRDETPDDVTESGDALKAKEGADEAAAAYGARIPEVVASLGAPTDDPLGATLGVLGYDDTGTIPAMSGPCDGRTGSRRAPRNHDLRPGTIFSPQQDTFAGLSSTNRPVYNGDLQTRVVSGEEQILVEGHVIDTAISDPVIGNWVTLSNIDQFQLHLWLQIPGQTQPIEFWGGNGSSSPAFEVNYLCYADDANLAVGSQITRGYFQAWVPTTNATLDYQLREPGFQVRTAIADHYWADPNTPYSWFWGADQKTVHLGPQPLAHHDPVVAGIGASLDRGFIVDDNAQVDDDLESLARGPITNAINNAIPSVDGSDGWAPGNGNIGLVYYHLNNVNPGSTSVDLSMQPAASPNGGNDDEYRFQADVQLNNVYVEGYIIAAIVGPCYFHFEVDAHATASGSIDIGQSPAQLTTDLELSVSGINIDEQFWSPIPLLCNLGYLAGTGVAERKLTTVLNNVLADFPERIGNIVSSRADAADYVNHTVNIGTQGNGFVTGFGAFDHTCAPYGCNGVRAGDVALVNDGLEVSGDLLVTDRKSQMQRRRFPFSYQPTTTSPVSNLIRTHTAPNGQRYSAAAFVSGGTLNQLLRSVTEGGVPNKGVFDTSMADGAALNMRPEVAPIFLRQSISGRTLSLFLPDLRVDNGGYERLAANLAVGLDVTYNASTHSLEPSTIGVSDISAGLGLVAIRCSSLIWAICTGVPQLITNVANELGNNILPQLTHNTINQVTLPSVAGMPILWATIANLDGQIGAFVKVGAQHVNVVWTSSANGQFHFTATPINFQGSGPVDYHWVITDDVDPNHPILDDVTNQSPNYAIPMSSVPGHGQLMGQPSWNFVTSMYQQTCWRTQRARATVTATQGLTSAPSSGVVFLLAGNWVQAATVAELSGLCS